MREVNSFAVFKSSKQVRHIINQSKYANDMLKRFGMDSVKSCAAPMSSSTKIDKNDYGISSDEKRYRGIIGSI